MSCLTKNITLHYLFDEDWSPCLYCKNQCTYSNTSSIWSITHQSIIDECILKCEQCNECYKITKISDKYVSFSFSCKDLRVTIYYDTENFSIEKDFFGKKIWINQLDNVNLNFANKDKLYNKLKTYVVMA